MIIADTMDVKVMPQRTYTMNLIVRITRISICRAKMLSTRQSVPVFAVKIIKRLSVFTRIISVCTNLLIPFYRIKVYACVLRSGMHSTTCSYKSLKRYTHRKKKSLPATQVRLPQSKRIFRGSSESTKQKQSTAVGRLSITIHSSIDHGF